MTDSSRSGFSRRRIDDSQLDRHLDSLMLFDPSAGFEDRVMSKVVVPPPLWVQDLKRNARSWIRTHQFRWIAAGMATISTISLVVAATLVLNNLEALEALRGLDLQELRTELQEQLSAARASAAESALTEIYIPEGSGVRGRSLLSQLAGDLVGLAASFIAMCSLGFGLVFFAPRQLEVVSDTVRHSFWQSFFAGFFAQPLILPAFLLLTLGLTLTVVGILAIPFVALAFAAATGLGVLGGYLAVARAVGEAYLRRRMSLGHSVRGWLAYRYVIYGLVALFAIWLPAALFGWTLLAGRFFSVTAVLITWVLATAGFGATLLSHAGIRGTFSKRCDQPFTNE